MQRWMKGVGALVLVAGIAGVADAGFLKHKGGCATESCGMVATCSTMTYVTEYRDVTRTVYKCVPVTTEQTITETVVTPVKSKETRSYVIYEQKMRTEPREQTVYLTKMETEKRKVTVYRPVQETINQDYYECVVTPRTESRPVTTYVPETHMEQRTQAVTTMKQVPEVVTRNVTCYQRVAVPNPCYDPCNPCSVPSYCQTVPVCQTIATTVMRCIPETKLITVQVPVCTTRAVTTMVNYTVYDRQMVKKTRPVTIVTMKPMEETIDVQVCKTYPTVQKYNVQVCYTEAVTKTQEVEVVTYKSEQRTRKVPVTTYTTVPETIVEKVPVTICVPVMPVCAPVVPCVK